MNNSKLLIKFAQKAVFILTFFIGVATVNIFAQQQVDAELVKQAKNFGEAFKNADAEKMNGFLADDFQYFTNVPCDYKDCDAGARKDDYTKGVVEERKAREFTILSVKMKSVKPIVNSNASPDEKAISFYCEVTMSAKGKTSRFYSFVNYHFQKREDGWKITKIENQIVQ